MAERERPRAKDTLRNDTFSCYIPGLFEKDEAVLSKERDPLYFEFEKAFPLARLDRVAQLGFLAPVVFPDRGIYVVPQFSRGSHTRQVARATELILRNNNAPDEMIKNGIVAGLLHDIATPAGGDAIKALDPVNLNEETQWQKVLDANSKAFLEKHEIDEQLMSDTIRNKGLLGQVLDVADRMAYTYTDSFFLGNRLDGAALLHKDVQVDFVSENIYFSDPDKLLLVLQARAKNHVGIYLHPENRATDVKMRKLLSPYYSPEGDKTFSPDLLRSMTDQDLFEIMGMQYGVSPQEIWTLVTADTEYSEHKSKEEVDTFQKDHPFPETVVFDIEPKRKFNPGISYKVKDPNSGEIMSLAQYNPEESEKLQDLARRSEGYYVYHA